MLNILKTIYQREIEYLTHDTPAINRLTDTSIVNYAIFFLDHRYKTSAKNPDPSFSMQDIRNPTDIFDPIPYVIDRTLYVPHMTYVDMTQLSSESSDDKLIESYKNLLRPHVIAQHQGSWSPKFVKAAQIRMGIEFSKMSVDKASKAFDFMLLHEIGHIRHQHSQKCEDYANSWRGKWRVLNALCFGIPKAIKCLQLDRQHEREADQFAVQHCPEGCKILFDFVIETQKKMRNRKNCSLIEKIWWRFFINKHGHNRSLYVTYPNETKRRNTVVSQHI